MTMLKVVKYVLEVSNQDLKDQDLKDMIIYDF